MAEDYYDENKPTRKPKKLPVRNVKASRAAPKKTEVKERVVKNAKAPGRTAKKK